MQRINQEIVINKEDVIPYIYFVCSLAQRGRMYGGLSGKSDYIGGIFDRWINIIPESVIFNKYFLPKIADNLSVISDYYKYKPKESGIAPDVLGIKVGTELKPFVEYVNEWRALEGSPQIEVKTFKKAQYMVSLRNQGYDHKYLVLVETNLNCDYLLPFFEQTVTDDSVYEGLKMNDEVFIKSNDNSDVSSVARIDRQNTNLGSLKPITVCMANDFMSFSTLCFAKESPVYVERIRETRSPKIISTITPFSDIISPKGDGLYRWNGNVLDAIASHKMLDIYVDGIQNIRFIKNSKSSVTIITTGEAMLNDIVLQADKAYIIKFGILDRSSKDFDEYFAHKSIVDMIPSKEEIMLADIRRCIE